MPQLAPIIAIVLLVAFYFWMFRDMTSNDNIPPCFVTFSSDRDQRYNWTLAFVLLNIFAEAIYYLAEHRSR